MIRHAACTGQGADAARRAAVRRLAVAWVALVMVVAVGCGGQAGAGDVPTSLDTPEITRAETIGTWETDPAWEEAALGPDEPPAADARWNGLWWHVPADSFALEWTAVRGADAYALYLDGELRSVVEFMDDGNPSQWQPREEFPRQGELTVVAIVWADPESVVSDDVNADFQLMSEPSVPVPLPEPCDARVHDPTDPDEIWCRNRSVG